MRLSVPLLAASVLLNCQLEVWSIPFDQKAPLAVRATKTKTTNTKTATATTTHGSSKAGAGSHAKSSSRKASASSSPSKRPSGSSSARSSGSVSGSIPSTVDFSNTSVFPKKDPTTTKTYASEASAASSAALAVQSGKCKASGTPAKNSKQRRFDEGPHTLKVKRVPDNVEMTFTTERMIGRGAYGKVFTVNEACNIVAKLLIADAGDDDRETENLRAVRKLYGYSGTGKASGDWIVMLKEDGVPLQSTRAWAAVKNRSERTKGDFLASAARLVGRAAYENVMRYNVDHNDVYLHSGNALFEENSSGLTKANLVDWGKGEWFDSSKKNKPNAQQFANEYITKYTNDAYNGIYRDYNRGVFNWA